MNTTFIIKCFALALCALAVTGCSKKEKDNTRTPVRVSVMTVAGATYDKSHEYVGTVEEEKGSVLSFEVPGNVVDLRVDAGDRVVKGQLLGTISPTTLKESHRATAVALRQARDAYDRMRPLHEQGVISDIKWVDVESKLHQTEAAERIAREQLSHTGLYAPFTGVIASKDAETGMNVLAGQQIYKLVDIARINVKIAVPEGEIASVKEGQPVRVTVQALQGATFEGTVREKGVAANPISHTYDVKIVLANTNGRLMPGMVCSATLAVGQDRPQTIVPTRAIELDTDNTRFVWVVAGSKAARRVVTIGDFAEGGVTVTSGLAPGDRVIIDGAQKVSEGMAVSTGK